MTFSVVFTKHIHKINKQAKYVNTVEYNVED